MTEGKKKLRIIQVSLIVLSLIIIFYTYNNNQFKKDEVIIPKSVQKKIKEEIKSQNESGDIFFNIEYSGVDLSGNRFILKSEEAQTNKTNQNLVMMKNVDGNFYFKDETILKIESTKGIYNNKTLDVIFIGNVKAYYKNSTLFAQRAEYNSSKNYLKVTEYVQIRDVTGSMFADELFFDIKKQILDVTSYNDNKINTNLNLK